MIKTPNAKIESYMFYRKYVFLSMKNILKIYLNSLKIYKNKCGV